ncbi:MAG: hypothetical protein JSS25_08515 [Proteobacteria bacterium]|nr:hypothetical protein [Pseudomonadota bacterium]
MTTKKTTKKATKQVAKKAAAKKTPSRKPAGKKQPPMLAMAEPDCADNGGSTKDYQTG